MNESIKVPIDPVAQQAGQNPLNYPVPDPNNPGAMMPRYPVTSVMDSAMERPQRGAPAASAHAYIDYLEGCLQEIRLRLLPLEQAHADLVAAFFRRCAEFEARLDDHSERLNAIEHPIVTKNR
jgi:hypothetical protein